MVWTRYTPPIHVAKSLNALAAEFDKLFPSRVKLSDGALGNASHQAEVSDHNPCWGCAGDRRGIIRAVDLTTTSWGVARADHSFKADQRAWHQALIADLIETEINNPVDRLWYLIHYIPGDPYPKIWSRTTGWEPKRYTGASPHDHHFHTSLMRTVAAETDTKPWFTKLHGATVPVLTPPVVVPPIVLPSSYPHPDTQVVYLDKVKAGVADSDSVYWVQKALGVALTGNYDVATVSAAAKFQASLGDTEVDGQLGPKQLAALFAKANLTVAVEQSSAPDPTPEPPVPSQPTLLVELNAGAGNLQGALQNRKTGQWIAAEAEANGDCTIYRFAAAGGKPLDHMVLNAKAGYEVHPTGWSVTDDGQIWVTWNENTNDVVRFKYQPGKTITKADTTPVHVFDSGNIQLAMDDTDTWVSLRKVTKANDIHRLFKVGDINSGDEKPYGKTVTIARTATRIVQGYSVLRVAGQELPDLVVMIGLKSAHSAFRVERWSFTTGKKLAEYPIGATFGLKAGESGKTEPESSDGSRIGIKALTGKARRLRIYDPPQL